MKLRCIKSMAAHWGVIFQYDNYYQYTISPKEVTFITNYKARLDLTNLPVYSTTCSPIDKSFNQFNNHSIYIKT